MVLETPEGLGVEGTSLPGSWISVVGSSLTLKSERLVEGPIMIVLKESTTG